MINFGRHCKYITNNVGSHPSLGNAGARSLPSPNACATCSRGREPTGSSLPHSWLCSPRSLAFTPTGEEGTSDLPAANRRLTAFRSQPFRSLLPPGNVPPPWASVTLILGLLLSTVKLVAVSRAGLIARPSLTGSCSCFAPVKGPGFCPHLRRQELGSHTAPRPSPMSSDQPIA